MDSDHTYELITIEQLKGMTKAERSNCTLNTMKLEREGIRLRPVEEAVRACLVEYKQKLGAPVAGAT